MNSQDFLHHLAVSETNPARRVDRVMREYPSVFRNLRLRLVELLQEGLPGMALELPGVGYVEVSELDDLYDALVRAAGDHGKFVRSMQALLASADPSPVEETTEMAVSRA